MIVKPEGSIYLLQPESDIEYEFLFLNMEHDEYQWVGSYRSEMKMWPSLSVDHRYIEDVCAFLEDKNIELNQLVS